MSDIHEAADQNHKGHHNKMVNNSINDEQDEKFKIAICQLQFNNSKLIDMLKERGTFIRTNKIDKLNEINKQMKEYLDKEDTLTQI